MSSSLKFVAFFFAVFRPTDYSQILRLQFVVCKKVTALLITEQTIERLQGLVR